MTKHFTPEEANHALPQVRSLVAQIMQAREAIISAQPELWPMLEKSIGNGGSKKAGELLAEFRRVENGIQDLQEIGCELKDMMYTEPAKHIAAGKHDIVARFVEDLVHDMGSVPARAAKTSSR